MSILWYALQGEGVVGPEGVPLPDEGAVFAEAAQLCYNDADFLQDTSMVTSCLQLPDPLLTFFY